MSENNKNEQTGLLYSGHQELTKQSVNLVRRGLNHLSNREPRIVSFPKDWSLGTLYIVDDGTEVWKREIWEAAGKAIGNVTVRPRRKLILEVGNREHESPTTVCQGDYFHYFCGDNYESEHLVDLSPLATLKPDDLQGVELEYHLNWLPTKKELELIERLTGLEWLGLSGIPVGNLSFLENLTQLRGLTIWGTDICRLTPIHKLTNLRYLSLEVTELFDLEYFEGLVNLEVLHIHLNEDLFELAGFHPSFDVNLSCLKGLRKLRSLDLRGLNIEKDVEAIKEELDLPECEISI